MLLTVAYLLFQNTIVPEDILWQSIQVEDSALKLECFFVYSTYYLLSWMLTITPGMERRMANIGDTIEYKNTNA